MGTHSVPAPTADLESWREQVKPGEPHADVQGDVMDANPVAPPPTPRFASDAEEAG